MRGALALVMTLLPKPRPIQQPTAMSYYEWAQKNDPPPAPLPNAEECFKALSKLQQDIEQAKAEGRL